MLRTVRVPPGLEGVFEHAEALVARWFGDRRDDPARGTIEIHGERYVLVRAAGLSVDFFVLVRGLYGPGREAEADDFACHILFDLAHALGKSDANVFHTRLGVTDPIDRMSAGPVQFAHAGWASVDILAESAPSPDESFYLLYDHPYSFEADAWIRAGLRAELPVCIMSAGYSSGWCEESYGVTLVAAELSCRARGDEHCRFVMAHRDRIEQHLDRLAPRGHAAIPDFFARKRMEEDLRRTRAELEERVRERTEELRREMVVRQEAERQLLQRDKLEALGRLAGGVAHDFNNLMAVVISNCGLLTRRLGDDPRRSLVEEIQRAGERAADLTSQLLAFGRAQAHAPEGLSMNRVVEDLGRMLGRLLGDDVELRVRLGHEGWVLADRGQLEQVIVNLVVNGRDAMPRGGVLSLATGLAVLSAAELGALGLPAGSRSWVVLSIGDTGQGMDERTKKSMFDPFFTTKERGTGLGLSTVHGIVQQAGGSVSVVSTPGHGTTMVVYLPAVAAPADRPAEMPADDPREQVRSARVLLVEDQPALRTALVAALSELGYEVVAAADAEAALELVGTGGAPPPELLITDLMLPRMSGDQLAARLLERRPSLRVLFMSGRAGGPELEGVLPGGVDFVAKPFTIDQLATSVAALLDRGARP